MTKRKIFLKRELTLLCSRNRDGSGTTQTDRKAILMLCADQLIAAKFYNLAAGSLKPKHVWALVNKWLKEDGISVGVIKNRMACLRWWAEKINKPSIIAKSNSAYGIPDRRYADNISKARELDDDKLAKIKDERIRCSLELQRAFGLRREESLKFQPQYADLGNRIRLKPSWAKGGRARGLPIICTESYSKQKIILFFIQIRKT